MSFDALRAKRTRRLSRSGARSGIGAGLWLWLALMAAACVPTRGGWELDALGPERSQSLRRRGSRLGDMTPFPAWLDGRLVGVACRWPSGTTLPVYPATDPAHEAWLAAALRTVDRALAEVELDRWPPDGRDGRVLRTGSTRPSDRGIAIAATDGAGTEGPLGSADTRVRCDVGPASEEGGLVRGEVVEAEIRIRSRMVDAVGRVHVLTAEEWVGALMHELAHALGFQGHAALGDSVLVLARDALRRAGRRALADESIELGPLMDLYALRPGQPLHAPTPTPASREWLEAISRRLARRSREGGTVSGPWASVGDRTASLEWWVDDRQRLRIVFPGWARRLREGEEIVARPDWITREWLQRSARARGPGPIGTARQLVTPGSRLRARSM